MFEITYDPEYGHVLPDGKIAAHCAANIDSGFFSETTGSELTLLAYRSLFKERGISAKNVIFYIIDKNNEIYSINFDDDFKLRETDHYPSHMETFLYSLL